MKLRNPLKISIIQCFFFVFQTKPGLTLPVIGRPKDDTQTALSSRQRPNMKVKVLPGMSPSCNRVPINEATEDCPSTTREKRNDIYRIYADRYDNIAMRKRLEISQLFIGRHSTNIA